MLYKSYQARGYLQFLGQQAKQGTLQEEHLPLTGWPRKRIKGWWRQVWVLPWMGHKSDVLEPWLVLPWLFVFLWMMSLWQIQSRLNWAVAFMLAVILSAVLFALSCVVLVWSQRKDEEPT
jgi:hypothetical protein